MARNLQWIIVLTTSTEVQDEAKEEYILNLLAAEEPTLPPEDLLYVPKSEIKQGNYQEAALLDKGKVYVTLSEVDDAFFLAQSNIVEYVREEFSSLFHSHHYQIICEEVKETPEKAFLVYLQLSQGFAKPDRRMGSLPSRKSEKRKLPPIRRKSKSRSGEIPFLDRKTPRKPIEKNSAPQEKRKRPPTRSNQQWNSENQEWESFLQGIQPEENAAPNMYLEPEAEQPLESDLPEDYPEDHMEEEYQDHPTGGEDHPFSEFEDLQHTVAQTPFSSQPENRPSVYPDPEAEEEDYPLEPPSPYELEAAMPPAEARPQEDLADEIYEDKDEYFPQEYPYPEEMAEDDPRYFATPPEEYYPPLEENGEEYYSPEQSEYFQAIPQDEEYGYPEQMPEGQEYLYPEEMPEGDPRYFEAPAEYYGEVPLEHEEYYPPEQYYENYENFSGEYPAYPVAEEEAYYEEMPPEEHYYYGEEFPQEYPPGEEFPQEYPSADFPGYEAHPEEYMTEEEFLAQQEEALAGENFSGQDEWDNFIEDLSSEVDIKTPDYQKKHPSHPSAPEPRGKLSHLPKREDPEDDKAGKNFSGRGLFLTEEEIALEQSTLKKASQKKKGEDFSLQPPSPNPDEATVSKSDTSSSSETGLIKPTIQPRETERGESPFGEIPPFREEASFTKVPSPPPPPSSPAFDKKSPTEQVRQRVSSSAKNTSFPTPESLPTVVEPQKPKEVEESAKKGSVAKPKRKSRLMRFTVVFLVLPVLLFTTHLLLEQFAPDYSKFILQEFKKMGTKVRNVAEPGWDKINEWVGEKPGLVKARKDLQVLMKLLLNEIQERPEQLKWALDRLQVFPALYQTDPEVVDEIKKEVAIQKNILIEHVEKQVTKDLEKLLVKNEYDQTPALFEKYANLEPIQEKLQELKKKTYLAAKDKFEEILKHAVRQAQKGQFVEAIRLLEIYQQKQLPQIVEKMEEAKGQVLRSYVNKYQNVSSDEYQQALAKMFEFLNKDLNHQVIQTEYYIIWLIHHYVTFYTQNNNYQAAKQVLHQYSHIKIHKIQVWLEQFEEEVKAEEALWQNVCRGLLRLSQAKRPMEIFYFRKKERRIKGIVIAKGDIYQTGRFGVAGEKNRVLSINELQGKSLYQLSRLGEVSSSRESKKRTLYRVALFLFSRERFASSQKIFSILGRKQDFQEKLRLYR